MDGLETLVNVKIGDPASVERIPRRRRILAMLITVAAALFLSVGVMEIFFRVFIPVTDVPFYFWDPVIGPRRAPNQTGRRIIGNYRNTRYHFNVQGWNHPKDYVVAKPAGTRRVCLVGDSFVESLHVNPEETMFAVAERRMNRPERRNALSEAHMLELTQALRSLGEREDVRAVVLAAAGPVYCAGHDFADMVERDLEAMRRLFAVCTELMLTIERLPQPVVAQVQGIATAAGCQLVATCDLAVAAEGASFGWVWASPKLRSETHSSPDPIKMDLESILRALNSRPFFL